MEKELSITSTMLTGTALLACSGSTARTRPLRMPRETEKSLICRLRIGSPEGSTTDTMACWGVLEGSTVICEVSAGVWIRMSSTASAGGARAIQRAAASIPQLVFDMGTLLRAGAC